MKVSPRIEVANVADAEVRALVALHLEGMHESSPPGHVFALDLASYEAPGLTLWGAWRGEALAGMVALRRFGEGLGEIKSMRTHPAHLRAGVARALLDHVVAAAEAEGLRRLCLETGRGSVFDAAIGLYRARGFESGPAFADYEASAFNQFFHLALPRRERER